MDSIFGFPVSRGIRDLRNIGLIAKDVAAAVSCREDQATARIPLHPGDKSLPRSRVATERQDTDVATLFLLLEASFILSPIIIY